MITSAKVREPKEVKTPFLCLSETPPGKERTTRFEQMKRVFGRKCDLNCSFTNLLIHELRPLGASLLVRFAQTFFIHSQAIALQELDNG